jgi:hypothetical protein
MADKELRRLKRRELLKMLLVQCKETERLQRESDEANAALADLTERYERLIGKLNVKDERLNQKDAQISALKGTIEEMKLSRTIELEEAGSIAEAALKLNGIFEVAQQAADQYLMNIRRMSENAPRTSAGAEDRQVPFESGWRAGIRRKGTGTKSRYTAIGGGNTGTDAGQRAGTDAGGGDRYIVTAASGEIHG